jgi:glycosyltransferase involved in cell wall biosynthesis
MEKEPLVSVGIPCYNRPEGLRRTLECITEQTYRNLEIMISDNCSTNPDVERVGREFADKDKRVRYVRQIENLGMGRNFQFVLDEANGEYFMWAPDDDRFSRDYIEKCMNRIGSCGCCVTNLVAVNPKGEILNKYVVDKIEYFESDYKNFSYFINRISGIYFYAFYRRECLSECLKTVSDYFNGICEYLSIYMYIYYGMIELQEDLYFKTISEDYENDQISFEKYRTNSRDLITYNLKIMELINVHQTLDYFEKVNLTLRSVFRLLNSFSLQLLDSESIKFRIWRKVMGYGIEYLRIKCRKFSI